MLLTTILLAAPLPVAAIQAPTTSAPSQKLIEELRGAIASGQPGETYRVYAALDERMTYGDFEGTVGKLKRGERQRYVADTLRAFADARQGDVLGLLAEFEAAGEVSETSQLWITNTVRFVGTSDAIDAVAELPEVSYIGWEPQRDASEYQDAGAPLPIAGGGPWTTYLFEGFEGGAIPPGTVQQTTGCGDVYVTTLYGPKTGSHHLVMASSSDGCDGTATYGMQVDLSGVTTATLRFGLRNMGDEFHPGADVLEASNDAQTWIHLADLKGSQGFYVLNEIPLDGTGLVYDANVYFRWRWSDNYTPETDGLGIDDIEIADGFDPPPPPAPEPNLVQHQAPDLWNIGVDGSGVLLLNADDGTDLDHPDLINRIWTNPNEVADGTDTDGNGYVDDLQGWDFFDDDNSPDGGLHGTNTSGIMVGDGSSGLVLTGMAPGASLVAARIDGEGDQWEALQYGITIGVDAVSSSYSYKWYFLPKPDYHMHRSVSEMLLAAGIIHANSIGNDGGSPLAPIPFNISAPGLVPGPWRNPAQTQVDAGIGATLGCGGIELDDTHYQYSGSGPSPWEDLTAYDPGYPHAQNTDWFDYPVGGFGGGGQGLLKPDLVTYTNVVTTSLGGGHIGVFGGTSAATPHLGGTFCLLIDAQPNAEPRHISEALQRTAEDLGAPGKDTMFGAGKVQVFDAALRLFHLVKVDTPSAPLGGTVQIDTFGEPHDYFATLWSGALGSTATPVGTIDLSAAYHVLQLTQLDQNGEHSVSITVPNQLPLIGVDLFLQSVEDNLAGTHGQYLISVTDRFRVTP